MSQKEKNKTPPELDDQLDFADSLTRMFGKGELPSGDGDGQAQE